MRQVLADRNARLYFLAQSLSIFGDSSLWLAVSIWMKVLTGSNAQAGFVVTAFVFGTLFAPLCGMLVDRMRRRPLLIVANVISAVYLLSLLTVNGRSEIWIIYIVMFIYGVGNGLFDAAQAAIIPNLIDGDVLPEVNAMLQTARRVARLLSPLVGAGMFSAFGAHSVALLDSVSFIVAALVMWRLSIDEERPEPTETRWWDEFTAGARHIFAEAALRKMTVANFTAMAVWGFFESIYFAVLDGVHHSPSFFGVFMTVQGVGAVIAGPITSIVIRRLGETITVAASMAIFAAASLLMIVPWLPCALAGSFLIGFGLPWILVGFTTLIQRGTPSRLRGRAYAAFDVITNTPQMASTGYGAALIIVLDYRLLLVVMAVVFLGSGIYLLPGAHLGLHESEFTPVDTRQPAEQALGSVLEGPVISTADRAAT
jgi:MFS family permease